MSREVSYWEPTYGIRLRDLTDEIESIFDAQDIRPQYPRAAYEKVVSLNYLPQYVLGGDLSKWQGWINWPKYAQNAKYALIRAGFAGSAGGIFEDIEFQVNAAGAAGNDVIHGFYWFWRANIDPIAQADFFCGLISNKAYKLRPVVDVEVNDGMIATFVRDQLIAFINRVKANLGVDVLILYTRSSFWNPNVADSDQWEPLHLFIARYSDTLTHPWGDGLFVPRDWTEWIFWQWTSTGPGVDFGASSTFIDLDYFNGNLEQFLEYAGVPQEQPMTQTIYQQTLSQIANDGTNTINSNPADVPSGGFIDVDLISVYSTKPHNDVRVWRVNPDGQSTLIDRVRVDGQTPMPLSHGCRILPGQFIKTSFFDSPAGATLTVTLSGQINSP